MKMLYPDTSNQMLSGVCAGIGKYFDIDPTIVRLLWVLLVIAGGTGILAYIICAIVIPAEPPVNQQEWENLNEQQ